MSPIPRPSLAPLPDSASEASAAALALAAADEQRWIGRMLAGDVAAFEAFFRAHVDGLCDFAFAYLRVRELAEEVVQEVFTRLWTERTILGTASSVKGYLYAATRNRALNVLRRVRTEDRWASRVAIDLDVCVREEVESVATPPTEALEDLLRQAIASLPERQRTAVQMRWLHGMSYAEIAQMFGVTPKTVENHLTRALRQLRQLVHQTR